MHRKYWRAVEGAGPYKAYTKQLDKLEFERMCFYVKKELTGVVNSFYLLVLIVKLQDRLGGFYTVGGADAAKRCGSGAGAQLQGLGQLPVLFRGIEHTASIMEGS